MRAFWTLWKTQTKIALWPCILLVLCLVIASVCPGGNQASTSLFLLSLLALILSGPLLFGAEYAHGSRKYLSTRPVSPDLAFWTKILFMVLLLALFSLQISCYQLPDHYPFPSIRCEEIICWPVLFSVVADFTFWSALVTILLRDPVRGFLFSVLSFPIILAGLWLLFCSWFWQDLLTRISPLSFRFNNKDIFVTAFILSPVLFLGACNQIYICLRKMRLCFSLISFLLIGAFLAYLSFGIWCCNDEGKAFVAFPDREFVAGYTSENKAAILVHHRREGRSVHELKLFENSGPKTNSSSIPLDSSFFADSRELSAVITKDRDEFYLIAAAVGVPGSTTPELRVFRIHPERIEQIGNGHPVKEKGVRLKRVSEQTFLIAMGQHILHHTDCYHLIDLSKNELRPVTQFPAETVVLDEDVYRSYQIVQFRGSQVLEVEVLDATDERQRKARVHIKPFSDWAVHGRLFVSMNILTSNVTLLDLTDIHSPQRVQISHPLRVKRFRALLEKGLAFLGISGKVWADEVFFTASEKHLAFWYKLSCRMVLWDIHDRDHPKPVGSASIPFRCGLVRKLEPSSMAPFVRSDGALGYLVKPYGMIWIEFAKLIK